MKTADFMEVIYPNWPAPANVKCISTTRKDGVSNDVYASNNLASHVGDDIEKVRRNREKLISVFSLPASPSWLNQTHSNIVVSCDAQSEQADACYSNQSGQVCAVMTADCLPVLLCDRTGQQVAAVHAGWRGLLNGIIENTVEKFHGSNKDILAWLGPAIGKNAFEVGDEVFEAFCQRHKEAKEYFRSLGKDKYLADIYGLATLRLNLLGIHDVYGGEYCTYSEGERFYSYRRDGVCGRMASLIWLDK